MSRPDLTPTAADIAAWRRLARAAKACADFKPHYLDELKRAVAAHREVRFPDQTGPTVKVCRQLLGFARAWPALGPADRRSNAEVMRRVAGQVLGLAMPHGPAMAAAPPAGPPAHIPEPGEPGYRRDIFG